VSTATEHAPSRGWARSGGALIAAAALVVGAVVAVAAPASAAAIIPTADPACASTPVSSTPVLTDLAIAPLAVNVRRSAKTVVVTATANDSVALSRIYVSVRGGRTSLQVVLTRVGGTALDGTWRGSLVVPRWASKATYRVNNVFLVDSAGGTATYAPSRPGWGAWATSFAVTAVPDVTPPRLRGFTSSKRSVNTSTHAKKVAFRVTMTDGQSGVKGVSVQVVRDLSAARLVSVDLTRSKTGSHVWVGSVVVPAYVGKGTHAWKLRVLTVDRIGNRKTWTRSDLAARGWRSTLAVTSRTDTTAPTLAGFTFSPSSVDARSGEQQVAFSIRVKDAQSGPNGVVPLFSGPGPRLNSVVVTRVTGTAHDKTYTGYVVVPQCGASGTYTASVRVVDASGNSWQGQPADLAALGYATELTVQQLDAT
jgi:hypothetical protein